MKSSGNELSVLVRKISWITVGVVSTAVFLGAVGLAMDAAPGDPPAAMASKPVRSMRAWKSRYVKPKRSKYKPPKSPVTKGLRPSTTVGRDVKPKLHRPERLHKNKLKDIHRLKGSDRVMRPALAARKRPGRLSKEELQTRREERRKRQVERLGKRIQTLEDRIENYKQDGTRTEAQISRMERSLDRMRKRLKRMQDQKDR